MPRPRLTDQLTALGDRAGGFARSGRGQRVLRWLRRLVVTVIVAAIIYQLSKVGWGEVLRHLPTHPGFYALLVFVYLTQPLFEVLIYSPLWRTHPWDIFRACALKRVYNDDLVGYSGEVYFYLWATGRGIARGEAFRTVRDVNIVSSVTSMFVAITLVVAMVMAGLLDVRAWIGAGDWLHYAFGGIGLAAIIALVVVFRRHVFALPARAAAGVFLIHLARLATAHAAMIWMWSIAVPGVSLSVWLAFATVLIVMNRLPFVPSKDLLFVGAGVELARTLDVATAAVAGVLLVQSVAMRILNLAVLGGIRLAHRRGALPPPPEPELTGQHQ
jgi:hypothetical protein